MCFHSVNTIKIFKNAFIQFLKEEKFFYMVSLFLCIIITNASKSCSFHNKRFKHVCIFCLFHKQAKLFQNVFFHQTKCKRFQNVFSFLQRCNTFSKRISHFVQMKYASNVFLFCKDANRFENMFFLFVNMKSASKTCFLIFYR